MVFQNINDADCFALISYAQSQENWHGDWFLWSDIQCDNGMRMFIK